MARSTKPLKFDPHTRHGELAIALIETIRSNWGSDSHDIQEIAVALDAVMQGRPISPGESEMRELLLGDWVGQERRAKYYQHVADMAEEIVDDYTEAGEFSEEDADQRINESAEVIYTRDAMEILEASDNWQAIDEMGMESVGDDINQTLVNAAFWAQRQDIAEAVHKKAEEREEAREEEDENDDEPAHNPAPVARWKTVARRRQGLSKARVNRLIKAALDD